MKNRCRRLVALLAVVLMGALAGCGLLQEAPSAAAPPLPEPTVEVTPASQAPTQAVTPALVINTEGDYAPVFAQAVRAAVERFDESLTVEFSPALVKSAGESVMAQLLRTAVDMIRREAPEIFWIGYENYLVTAYGGTENGYGLIEITFNYALDATAAAEASRQMEPVIAEILAAAPADEPEAIRYFHDEIIRRTVYFSEAEQLDSMVGHEAIFNIQGVFLDGSAVCEGYAKAMKLLCDRAGIHCQVALGTADGGDHAWNYLQLDGGLFLVDCTWDDQPTTSYACFLRGLEAVISGKPLSEFYAFTEADAARLAQMDHPAGKALRRAAGSALLPAEEPAEEPDANADHHTGGVE